MLDKNLNPIILFQNWYEIASEKEINDPNAMCLSTVDKDNCPHSRMVLLKGFDENGSALGVNQVVTSHDFNDATQLGQLADQQQDAFVADLVATSDLSSNVAVDITEEASA